MVHDLQQMRYSYKIDWVEKVIGSISNVIACLCLFAVQYLLLKTDRLRKVLPPETIPTNAEVWFGIAAFWICHCILFALGEVVMRTLVGMAFVLMVRRVEQNAVPFVVSNAVRSLMDSMAVSWLLHHALLVLLDIIIPFGRNPRRDSHGELTKIHSRTCRLLAFLYNIGNSSPSTTLQIPIKILVQNTDTQSITQTVRLQRVQTNHPNGGQRILAWNLEIEKEALDEMKQTLGPPGGFGELGFNVCKDGIRFEAMGVGTSFALDFEVLAASKRRGVTMRRKTK
ncbi:hypothetical protein WAI453_004836 [Rhynchosporium graminicola]